MDAGSGDGAAAVGGGGAAVAVLSGGAAAISVRESGARTSRSTVVVASVVPLRDFRCCGAAISIIAGCSLCSWTAWLLLVPLFAEAEGNVLGCSVSATLGASSVDGGLWRGARWAAATALDPFAGVSFITLVLVASLATVATAAWRAVEVDCTRAAS